MARGSAACLRFLQLVLFTAEGGRVASIDQFVGDPAAVAAFWA